MLHTNKQTRCAGAAGPPAGRQGLLTFCAGRRFGCYILGDINSRGAPILEQGCCQHEFGTPQSQPGSPVNHIKEGPWCR